MLVERALWALESREPQHDWVIEDHFLHADLASEQFEWCARNFPQKDYRVVRYAPDDDHPIEQSTPSRSTSAK